jgi:protein O-GlcNAc transferase
MGAPFMDCIIADPVVIPESQEAAYTERVVRLPHCYLPWDSKRGRSPPSVDRVEAGLPPSGMVFCGFNNSYKITREAFQIWLSLLRDVPDSVLWLRSMNSDAAQNLRAAATAMGICSDRLIFAAHVEQIDHYLARLGLADLFLDTFPYNAHTTAADALCAGVPVLTCQGDSFASRVGASLLTSAGLPELICATADDYRAKALQLATSPAELSRVRSRVLEARWSSPVFDTGLYTRNLEALYFSIWDDARAGRAGGPESFTVESAR